MELSKLQEEIVNSDEKYVAVVAAAAAGKTRVLTEHVRMMLRRGIDPEDIAVITFTTLAASELRERLADDYRDDMYIGTIHGLAYRFLLDAGHTEVRKYVEDEKFDEFFALIKKFPGCVRHIPHILLDETQDTSPEEFEFIFKMIKPDTYFLVGDVRQSIFGFRGGSPELFMDIMYRPDVKVYNLNENYRNCDEILSFAKEILANGKMHDDSTAMQHGGKVIHYPTVNYTDLIKYLSTYGEWSDWAILSPKNDGVAEIMSILKQNGIPCITFKQKGLKKEDIDRLLQQNAVKVLTCHSAKGLEFDYVAMIRPEWWGNKEERIRLYYVAATRARKILIWMGATKPLKNYAKRRKTF